MMKDHCKAHTDQFSAYSRSQSDDF